MKRKSQTGIDGLPRSIRRDADLTDNIIPSD
jgi:hypothetical protein